MSWQSRIRTKKEYRERAVGKHLNELVFNPGIFPERNTGKNISVEGPYPVHTWYATVDTDENAIVVKVR